ncbi:MAG: GNAT family N-acetyltransferase [Chitinophagaceae bacterium]|nr:MAG: GNAT family N-acetyltransferase [Chitinophagaceae bacterium]
MDITWTTKRFDELTPFELYEILMLRSEVFVVEQDCVFLDMDGQKDFLSHHFMGRANGALVAYTRLVPPGIAYEEPSIGRVVTSPKARGTGIGRQLMLLSIEQVFLLFGKQPIHIGAQLYLKKFYESFGFVQAGDIYDEDGIDHIGMILS